MRMKIICAIIVVGWLFTSVLWLFSSQKSALRYARDQAAIRLLSDFHRKFITDRNVDGGSYLKELHSFQENHEGYDLLTTYVNDVEEHQRPSPK